MEEGSGGQQSSRTRARDIHSIVVKWRNGGNLVATREFVFNRPGKVRM